MANEIAEIWKPVNCVDSYLVSNFGRVMNCKTGKILTPRPTPNGYLRVHLPMVDGKRKDMYIHRLVADAFCFRPEGYDVVNHIDYDNKNNNADNLEWTTQRNNVLHSMDAHRYPKKLQAVYIVGEKDNKRYLFRSIYDAARLVGCDAKTIRRHCKTGKKAMNGFVWRRVG